MRQGFTIILFLLSLATFSQTDHKDSLNQVVDAYYRLNLKIFQSTSTPGDIDSLFLLFTEDFEYVHPKYGGTYSRQDLYDGYMNNQKNGRYNGRIRDIKILQRIAGLNGVSVEKQFITQSDDGLSSGDAQMTLFEFRDGKIFRIREFW